MPLIERQGSLSRQLHTSAGSPAAQPPRQSKVFAGDGVGFGEGKRGLLQKAPSSPPRFSISLTIHATADSKSAATTRRGAPGTSTIPETGTGYPAFRACSAPFPLNTSSPADSPALAANPRSSSLSPIMNVVSGKSRAGPGAHRTCPAGACGKSKTLQARAGTRRHP